MSTPNFGFLEGAATLEEIQGALAQLRRILDFYFQGKISTSNLREVGGWQVNEETLMAEDGDVGFSTIDTVADDLRIWAGDADRDIAPFRVYESGKVVVSNIEILGGTIQWASVGAPSYSDITGTKPPVNADNTESVIVGNGFTKVGPNYIYTGTINANQINVGTLVGFTLEGATIRTSYTSSGRRIVLDQSGFHMESGGIPVLSIVADSSLSSTQGIIFNTASIYNYANDLYVTATGVIHMATGVTMASGFSSPSGNISGNLSVGSLSGAYTIPSSKVTGLDSFMSSTNITLGSLASSVSVLQSQMSSLSSAFYNHNHTVTIPGHNHGISGGAVLALAAGGGVTWATYGTQTVNTGLPN